MQTKQIAARLNLELEMNFPEAFCSLDSFVVEKLEHHDTELVKEVSAAFSNKPQEESFFLLFNNLRDTISEISSYLWLISRNKPLFSNTAPEIIKNNSEIYRLAKENTLLIGKLVYEFSSVKNSGNINESIKRIFPDQLQKKLIQDMKIIHAWVKHLLKLSHSAEHTEN